MCFVLQAWFMLITLGARFLLRISVSTSYILPAGVTLPFQNNPDCGCCMVCAHVSPVLGHWVIVSCTVWLCHALCHCVVHCDTVMHCVTYCDTVMHCIMHCDTVMHFAMHCVTVSCTASLCHALCTVTCTGSLSCTMSLCHALWLFVHCVTVSCVVSLSQALWQWLIGGFFAP